MMKERTTARVFGIVRRIAGPDPVDQQTFIAIAASAIFSVVLVVGILATSAARGDDRPPQWVKSPGYWFELFAADRGAPLTEFRWKTAAGPFEDIAICYAAGAIGMNGLNAANPNKDFLGRCEGEALLDLREMADRARALLPDDSK